MNLLLIDDEPLLLMQLERAVKEVLPDARIHSFVKAREGLEYAKTEKPDIAFLDIQMRGIDGLSLAKELVTLHPDTNVVFCTGFVEYALDAYDAYASDYLLKPISPEAIRKAMKRLRHPLKVDKRVKFSCFGNFEAFCDGKPISFGLSRTKELLAYLVDRNGAECRATEICAVLFEDKLNNYYYHKLRSDLIKTFTELGIMDCLRVTHGGLAVNRDAVDCDYFDYRDGKIKEKPMEYMTQYTFGEFTLPLFSNFFPT